MLILKANKRAGEKMVDIRTEGLVPAVYYGFKKEATSISVPSVDFIKLFREAGETTAITLDVGGEKVSCLVHDVQRDPVTGAPVHVDFLVVDMNKETEVSVPLEFEGISEAEKSGIGMVMKVMHEISVSALPADLPHSILVDISILATLSDAIHAKDVTLPKGVTLISEPDEVVAAVTAFVEEKEDAPVLDLDSVEVEKKGKKEDGEEVEEKV